MFSIPFSAKNKVNDVYVVWSEYTRNGNEEIHLRRSTDGGNTFDNSTNLTINNNSGNNQLAQHPEIALSKIDINNAYVVWDANTTANNDEIFLRKITTTVPSLYDGNKSAISLGSNITISENANKSVSNGKGIGIPTTTTTAATTTSIAIIRPTFTAAAYDNAFYLFYKLNANATIMPPLEVTSQGMLVYCQTLSPPTIQYPKLLRECRLKLQ